MRIHCSQASVRSASFSQQTLHNNPQFLGDEPSVSHPQQRPFFKSKLKYLAAVMGLLASSVTAMAGPPQNISTQQLTTQDSKNKPLVNKKTKAILIQKIPNSIYPKNLYEDSTPQYSKEFFEAESQKQFVRNLFPPKIEAQEPKSRLGKFIKMLMDGTEGLDRETEYNMSQGLKTRGDIFQRSRNVKISIPIIRF